MNRLLLLATGATLLVGCSDSITEPPAAPALNPSLGASAHVTSSADDGEGSLRAAIEAANADPSIKLIQVKKNLGTVALQSPIHYEGSQDLIIHGGDVVLDGAAVGAGLPAFLADGGGDLALTGLTIENAPGYGVQVEVPAGSNGVQSLSLDRVTVRGAGFHGVLMNDQATPLLSPNPEDGDVTEPADAQDGSGASLEVRITHSTFENNGFDAIDNDGVRINEGGIGGIDFAIGHSRAAGNGADGIELDERGPGDARLTVQHTDIIENGFFDFNTPEEDRDLDDGIDVDEWGEGDLIGRFVQVKSNDNAEQGVDLNENEAGNLRVTMHQVEGSRNGQEGIEFEEDDDVAGGGNIEADLNGITTNANGRDPELADDEGEFGDGGLKSREKGAGDNYTTVRQAVSINNVVDGVNIREEGDGDIVARLTGVVGNDNGEYGIQIREANGGAIDARIANGSVSMNGDGGVRLRENGIAAIMSLSGSDAGNLNIAAGVTVTQTP
jgi:hypothetical protein